MNSSGPHVSSNPGANPLATTDQAEVEGIALRLLERPEIKQAQEEARNLFMADPLARTSAGRKTLDQAVGEYMLATIYDTILNDVSQTRMIWMVTPPHSWFGHSIGGARFGLDNADTVYRCAVLDPAGSYEIYVRHEGSVPAQFSFQLYLDNKFGTVFPGEQPVQSDNSRNKLDTPLGCLLDEDIRTAADGSYTVTLSPEPANGRANHIQTFADACTLFIRSALIDWSTAIPEWMEIRRLDQPSAGIAQSEAELAALTVQRLKIDVPFWLKFNNVFVFGRSANTLPTPRARAGGWGFSALGNFQIARDEALLVTTHPQGARYTGFQVTDPWSISREFIHRSSSLNNFQTRPNGDGSFTYAIAARDPGIANWLDTDGLESGGFILRWQAFPQQPVSGESLLREVKLVKIADLDRLLPGDTPRCTPNQRARELNARAKAYEKRFAE